MNPKLRNDSSVNVKNGDVTAEQGSNVNYAPSTTIFQNKKVVIGSVVAVVALLIIGFIIFRGSSLDSQLVGTWSCVDHSAQRQTFVFKSNHTVTVTHGDDEPYTLNWKINDSKILMFYKDGESQALIWNDNLAYSMVDERSWSISGDVLYMYGLRFDKQ